MSVESALGFMPSGSQTTGTLIPQPGMMPDQPSATTATTRKDSLGVGLADPKPLEHVGGGVMVALPARSKKKGVNSNLATAVWGVSGARGRSGGWGATTLSGSGLRPSGQGRCDLELPSANAKPRPSTATCELWNNKAAFGNLKRDSYSGCHAMSHLLVVGGKAKRAFQRYHASFTYT